MSEKIRPDEFRESMDRCLSGVKADPFLAGRVIASKEGEPRMKRKLSVSLVFVLVALLALGTVAYSATILFRSVNFDGEVVSTEPPRDLNDFFYGSDMTAAETKALVEQTADDVPDDIYCQAWYSSPKDGATYLSTHRRTKKCTSYEEFLECMKGVNNLHLPVLPPEEYTSFSAEVIMDCAYGNPLFLLEEGKNGPVQYVRYTYDEDASVITGYTLHFGYEDQSKDVYIESLLNGHVTESFGLYEGSSAEPITVSGMDHAILLSVSDCYNQIFMYRSLSWPDEQTRIHEPEKADSITSNNGIYRYETMTISTRNRTAEELLKVLTGE